jgi:hypothetical protein
MNLETIKEIEEQIDYHLETHDEALKKGNNDIVANCLLVITSLIDSLDGDTVNLRTEKTIQ